MTSPLDAAWDTVFFLGPVIWWGKALAGLFVGLALMLLPQPTRRTEYTDGVTRLEWAIVMWSRAGTLIGGGLLVMSVITPINAFGPLGDLAFYPSIATNIGCLLWCQRRIVWQALRSHTPESTLMRSFIAGRPDRQP